MKPRRWRRVTIDELNRVWKHLGRLRVCYCGCTHGELVRRYGKGRVVHRPGLGWYKLTPPHR